jgi:hypothetical protein
MELVEQASIIAIGQTTAPVEADGSVVIFKSTTMLKGEIGPQHTIRLCNKERGSEWFDLRDIRQTYVVFASRDGDCFAPVHGISSVILIEGRNVRTSSILDQPETQPVQAFVTKIRKATMGNHSSR